MSKLKNMSLCALLTLFACEAMEKFSKVAGAFAGNLLVAAANNYAPGHSQAVKALVSALGKTSPGEEEPSSAAEPLRIDVALLRETVVDGNLTLEPIEDGDVLRDGRDDLQKGDRFRIALRPGQDCFVYIMTVDATGWVTPILPSVHSSHANPVEKDREYGFPDPAFAYSLNTYRGIEHFYFVASREPRPDIEALLGEFDGKEQPLPASEERVEEEAVVTRGVDTTTTGADMLVATDSGERQVVPTAFLSNEGNDLVITRWFHHE